jgi:hypothetical protein
MNFHLAHIVPSKNLHGPNGYKEVIDTIQWGLQELGHAVTYGLNTTSDTATNIIFGAQLMSMEALEKLPPETIVYNFEQGKGWKPEDIRPQIRTAAQRFHIWDYSAANADVWKSLGAEKLKVVPVGFAPILKRIPKPLAQDIDVLIYGRSGQDRLEAFHFLAESGLTTVFVCGLYGNARDELIARSKLVLNINLYGKSKTFEIVRVSYLIANAKAVVADIDSDTVIDDDMRSAVHITSGPELVHDCQSLVSDDRRRMALEQAGFDAMQKRDIRVFLEQALKQ